jgi:hypothetical protein
MREALRKAGFMSFIEMIAKAARFERAASAAAQRKGL